MTARDTNKYPGAGANISLSIVRRASVKYTTPVFDVSFWDGLLFRALNRLQLGLHNINFHADVFFLIWA